MDTMNWYFCNFYEILDLICSNTFYLLSKQSYSSCLIRSFVHFHRIFTLSDSDISMHKFPNCTVWWSFQYVSLNKMLWNSRQLAWNKSKFTEQCDKLMLVFMELVLIKYLVFEHCNFIIRTNVLCSIWNNNSKVLTINVQHKAIYIHIQNVYDIAS